MFHPWKKISEKKVYQGYRDIIRKVFLLPNQREIAFDIIDVPSFVCIAAISKDREIILVDQYRPGPEKNMLSFPEGRIDPGEEALNAVERELREETGYQAAQIKFLKAIPHAYSNQLKYGYVALDCERKFEQDLDENEFIEVRTYSIQEFRHLLQDPAVEHFNSVDMGYLLLDYLGELG